jgi:MscS family membrane protein
VYFNGFGASSLDVLLYCFLDCPDWSIELREKHRLFSDILRLAQKLDVAFAFPTRTVHLFNEQHAPSAYPSDAGGAQDTGRAVAARIAGPLRRERPGPVEFTGPSHGDWSAEVGDEGETS